MNEAFCSKTCIARLWLNASVKIQIHNDSSDCGCFLCKSHCLNVCLSAAWIQFFHCVISRRSGTPAFALRLMTNRKTTHVKASSRLPKHKKTPRNPMKAKIPTPRKKVTVYTRCTRCDSFREKLRVKNGYWRFKHEYCLHCGGVLEITTVLQ